MIPSAVINGERAAYDAPVFNKKVRQHPYELIGYFLHDVLSDGASTWRVAEASGKDLCLRGKHRFAPKAGSATASMFVLALSRPENYCNATFWPFLEHRCNMNVSKILDMFLLIHYTPGIGPKKELSCPGYWRYNSDRRFLPSPMDTWELARNC